MSFNPLTLEWSPTSGYPTITKTVQTLSSIDPTVVPALSNSIVNAAKSLATDTFHPDMILLSRVIRGAKASLTALEAQKVLATATDSSVVAQATDALFKAAYNLEDLAMEENLYDYVMNKGVNIFFLVMFALVLFFNIGMLWKSRYHWYNVTFICGFILEFLGFLGRVLSTTDYTDINFYLLQYAPLTIAPAFIMGGIYFIFAQNVIMYGREYTVLKPMWYTYFFVASDVICLVIQGVGGGMASSAAKNKENPDPGTWTMFVGVLAQVIAMSVFLIFWLNFLYRLYFRNAKAIEGDWKQKKRTPGNFFKLLFNIRSIRTYRNTQLEQFYNEKYTSIRQRKLIHYFPLAITIAVIAIYIRCIYRVVELKQGFSGYLITHEVFIMVLDAMLVLISGFVFIPFHPVFVFGQENVFNIKTVRNRKDVEVENGEKEATSLEIESGESERAENSFDQEIQRNI